ncbi:MAG: N-acetylmuramoyl-L-alanine amidase [Thermoanaerobaculia bacterium]
MKDRRFRACFLFLALLLPVLVAAQGQRPPAPVPPTASTPTAAPPGAVAPPARSSVTLEGREIAVPVVINQSGPMFGLSPIAEALGGKMTSDESGESITLRIADKDVVIGPGNAIITVGDNIISLSQPPSRGEGGLQVPVDFLKKTFGDLLGYAFEWHPEISRLTIARRGNRELAVTLDVVHLQGMTTIVLQFPEEPRYQIDRSQPGAITVQMLSDQLTPPPAKEVQDPLVQAVVIGPQQVRIQLAAGAQAENYVLENPFRLVFDIHPTSSVDVPAQPLERTKRAPGIHLIVIDPGHGGAESGAVGPGGVMEKDLTLEFARELAGKLGRLGVQTLLTRNEDVTVPHDARPALANQNRADLFISIHLNSSLGAGAHGTETYFLSPQATDARAARAAAAENATPPAAGATATAPGAGAAAEQEDVDLILWDLAQSHHLSESQRLANLIQGELNTALQLKDRGVKQAPFRVLKGATMPAVLVELGFISNPEEEKKLQDPAYRDQLLDSLVTAIARYRSSIEGQPAPAPGAPAPGASAPASPPPAAPPATTTPPATKPPARPAQTGKPS